MDTVSKKYQLRPLGALEQYAWKIDTFGPKHFTVSAEVTRRTTLDEWLREINKLQKRHPLIWAGVDVNDDNELCFFMMTR
ncbi:TPA: hypothetical protein OKD72_004120 [Escherichia coli]|nr:hypothetical protein [Escherichia coli]HCQ3813148.1 hypothetical protein [Escherichia coli]HCQ3844978.1 hypothetical protein [Escherichia coli]